MSRYIHVKVHVGKPKSTMSDWRLAAWDSATGLATNSKVG